MKISQWINRGGSGAGPAAFIATGALAAFGAGACCALPLLLAGAGLGTIWLSQIAAFTAPYSSVLLFAAAAALSTGAILLLRQQLYARRCTDQSLCGRPASRLLTLAGLAAGFVLLLVAWLYG